MTLLWITFTISILSAAGGTVFVVYQVRVLRAYEARQAAPYIEAIEQFKVFEREVPIRYLSLETWQALFKVQMALAESAVKADSSKNNAASVLLERFKKRAESLPDRYGSQRFSIIQSLASGNVIRQNLQSLGYYCQGLLGQGYLTRPQMDRLAADINRGANQVLSEALLIEVQRKMGLKEYGDAAEDIERYMAMHKGLSKYRDIDRAKEVADGYFKTCQSKLGYLSSGRAMLTLG